jgi:hypothetical protein
VTYFKSFLSLWYSIKRIPRLLVGVSGDPLANATVLPWAIDFIKSFSEDYRKNKRNSWDYLLAHFPCEGLSNEKEKRRYLIEQLNASLLAHSPDKENPWVINDSNENFIEIKKQRCLEFDKQLQKGIDTIPSLHFSKLSESVTIQLPPPGFWEQTDQFTNKNPISQFFEIVWNSVSNPSNLLKWISFGFIVFSIPLHFFPYIVLGIAGLAFSYLILQCVLAVISKPESISLNLLTKEEEENLIQTIKQEIFNQERYKQELSVIQKQLSDSTVDLTKVTEYFFAFKKTDLEQLAQQLRPQDSSLYQQLSQVYPKTQFMASLVVKLTSTILYGYLVSWAASALFTVLGVSAAASFLASPVGVGFLILIPAFYFLIQHLRQSRSKEDFYQKKIHSLLNTQCEYSFTDAAGKTQRIKLEKWKKFECLREEIRLLEIKITTLIQEKKLAPEAALCTLFNDHCNNSDRLYQSSDQDKTQRENPPFFTKVKKTINRSFAFLAGGSYGYGLGQQIAVESSLGIKTVLKIVLLPVLLPLIIINAIANLVVYHLNAKQRDKIFFATHLDSKLQNLEYTRKKLYYLGATLSALESPAISEKLEATKQSEAQPKPLFIKTKPSSSPIPTKFFKSTLALHASTTTTTQEDNHTNSAASLTR